MLIDSSTTFDQVKKLALETERNYLKEVSIFDVYQGDKVEKGKKSIALKVVYQAPDHTLSEEEITSLYQKTIEACKKGLNAELRIA